MATPCGCVGNDAFEKAILSAAKVHNKVVAVKYFSHCCPSCSGGKKSLCSIVSDLPSADLRHVHGLTLQRAFGMMDEATRDAPNRDYLLAPLQTRVRHRTASTPKSIVAYAEKLTVIFNALCEVHPNGTVINLVANDDSYLPLSIQGFVMAA